MTVRRAKTIVGAIGSLAVVAYLGAAAYLRINERSYIYLPGERRVSAPAASFGLGERHVTYPSTNGVMLSAWIIPAAPDRASGQWLLICHGNYGNVGFGQRPEFYSFMRELGVSQFAFDYRGFGESTGTPGEEGVYADATASYEYLTRTLGVSPDHIVIYGHSLGSGVAIELATRVKAAGLVVEGAYTSVVDRASELYPLLPISLLATQKFPSLTRIPSIAIPKLFLHSPEDAVIPFAHGQRLFAAATDPKRFVDVKGGHENAYSVDRARYFGAMADLFRQAARKD